ncbi:NAD-dependent epimerase/dehydratase family protein [Agarivorans sp. QJM3NY_33]|uniref:NAD-dependent epimerase/dehydratase family protein n=1 Tax=Agarivorans sp. QJM3NY_33 TaxID=3421432 RepID=UPI003D7D8A0A
MNTLVTGASGFIGRTLLSQLSNEKVTGLARGPKACSSAVNWVSFDLEELLEGKTIHGEYDTVVHLAARAHILNDKSKKPLEDFLRFNKDVSLELAKQMFHKGMKRFVFVSSIGVNGSKTRKGEIFSEDSIPMPVTDYGKSKFEAENGLRILSEELGFELVVIRPPLVYGKGAPGNFGQLIKLMRTRLPLPFGYVYNRKSFVSVNNLANFIAICCKHPNASNKTFLIADDGTISTRDLLVELSDNKTLLLPVPSFILHSFLCCLGRKKMSTQLLSDLVIDNSYAKQELDWKPLETTKEALNKIVADW